jgi:hypothetical protein
MVEPAGKPAGSTIYAYLQICIYANYFFPGFPGAKFPDGSVYQG